MIKKIGYAALIGLILLILAGSTGVRYFNQTWFKERPNFLRYSSDTMAINFDWASNRYGAFMEPHDAIIIPVKIQGLSHQFYFQFDTGVPTSFINGNTVKSLKEHGVELQEVVNNDHRYLQNLDFTLGGIEIKAGMMKIIDGYGNSFKTQDTIRRIKIGTIGSDFMDQRITLIDFKNEVIQCYEERPKWMSSLPDFEAFDFKGRRFMLPAEIEGKELELFYDSGSSAFGLITSKKRYDDYTDKNAEEINYDANRHGDAIPIHHKNSNKMMKIGTAHLDLKRISYVDMYANYQKYISPFTRIGGWLGNKPFTESTLVLDTKKEEFIIFKSARVK